MNSESTYTRTYENAESTYSLKSEAVKEKPETKNAAEAEDEPYTSDDGGPAYLMNFYDFENGTDQQVTLAAVVHPELEGYGVLDTGATDHRRQIRVRCLLEGGHCLEWLQHEGEVRDAQAHGSLREYEAPEHDASVGELRSSVGRWDDKVPSAGSDAAVPGEGPDLERPLRSAVPGGEEEESAAGHVRRRLRARGRR